MGSFSTVDAIAIYAAIVATGALALEIRRWFESGPKLHLTVMSRAQLFGSGSPDEAEYLAARVTNRGDRPTTITNYGLHEYMSRFHRWRYKAPKSAIVPMPELFGGAALPHVLQPGTEWSGMAKYDAELVEWAKTGSLFVAIYSSHSKRPEQRLVEYKT